MLGRLTRCHVKRRADASTTLRASVKGKTARENAHVLHWMSEVSAAAVIHAAIHGKTARRIVSSDQSTHRSVAQIQASVRAQAARQVVHDFELAQLRPDDRESAFLAAEAS